MPRRRWPAYALLVGLGACCARPSPRSPDEQPRSPDVALKIERFDEARHRGARSPTTYRMADEHPGTWLEVARSPDRRSLAVARGEAVELRALPDLTTIWSAPVSPEEPYRHYPTHPLLAFTGDGSRVAWLGGAGFDHRFVVFAAANGAVQADLVFAALSQPSGGGGATPPATPEALHWTPDGRRFRIFNSFATHELEPASPRLVQLGHDPRDAVRPILAQDTGEAWDVRNGVLTERGGGRRFNIDCATSERDVAIDVGLDRVAYPCDRGASDERPEIRLLRLSSGELLGSFPFSARWARLVILDADTVLALARTAPRHTVLVSTTAPLRRHEPATDTWISTTP